MKQLLALSIVFLTVSFSQKPIEEPNKESNIMLLKPTEVATNSFGASKDEGIVLIEGSDGLGCHKIDAKWVNPFYQDVSNICIERQM